jgi:urease accessory protein
MPDLPAARRLRPPGSWQGAADRVTLDYEGRFLRRRVLTTDSGREVLVDLPETTSLSPGAALECDDGTLIEVLAAAEDLLAVSGDLPRLAWHIGNRHAPCRIEADRLLIRADPVLAGMLAGLGARVTPLRAPFEPEGGAYGAGRTLGHDHHGPGHGHAHVHHHGSHHGAGDEAEDDADAAGGDGEGPAR